MTPSGEERTRHRFVAIALAVAVVWAGLLAGGVLAAAGSAQEPTHHGSDDGRTITVTGVAEAEAPPDRAVVAVAVVATGDDVESVRTNLSAGTEALRGALADAGVADDDVETTDYWIRDTRFDHLPEDHPGRDRPRYRGEHAFRISLDDVDAADTVADAALGAGAEVRWVGFEASDALAADLRDRALADAVRDANGQAETLADATDLRISGVRAVDASGQHPRPFALERDVAEGAADGATVFVPGNVTVSVDVRITYDAAAD